MNAKDIVILVCEKKAPAPYWSHTRGIYADLSEWPRHIDYYVKCPECGSVHGFYKSLADARSKRLCQNCDHDRVEKLKKEIAKVTEDEQPLVPFDPDIPVNPKAEVKRYMSGDWITVAKWELEQYLGTRLEIDTDRRDSDPDNPESTDIVYLVDKGADRGKDVTYKVWKNDDLAEAEALEQVRNDLESEPENFNQDWLTNFIDLDRLRNTLRQDQDTWTREDFDDQHRDYEDKVKAMVEAGKLDEGIFFKQNGELRKVTPEREALLERAIEEWVEEEVANRLSDPMEYLDEIYGKEDALKQAKEWGGIKIDDAAKSAVNTDGWQHFISHYDGKSIDLKSGAVAVRE